MAKLDSTGSQLLYSTYLGGAASDTGYAIALDAGGSIYVAGTTLSTDFPTINAVQPAYGGGYSDVFVAKLDAAGSLLDVSRRQRLRVGKRYRRRCRRQRVRSRVHTIEELPRRQCTPAGIRGRDYRRVRGEHRSGGHAVPLFHVSRWQLCRPGKRDRRGGLRQQLHHRLDRFERLPDGECIPAPERKAWPLQEHRWRSELERARSEQHLGQEHRRRSREPVHAPGRDRARHIQEHGRRRAVDAGKYRSHRSRQPTRLSSIR